MKYDPALLEQLDQLLDEDTKRLMRVMAGESDRGAILVGSAKLDDTLTEVLRAMMIEEKEVVQRVFGRGGIADSFGRKITLAHALGLISAELAQALDRVRDIRNHCAHHIEDVRFSAQKIRDTVANMEPLAPEIEAAIESTDNPVRERFLFNIGALDGFLRGLLDLMRERSQAIRKAIAEADAARSKA